MKNKQDNLKLLLLYLVIAKISYEIEKKTNIFVKC